ncbi:MAG: prolipoprotein diacylglyceryl transferase [Armatimonadota bacterium]
MYPVILRIGPITVFSYGLMLALAFGLAVLWASRQASRRGVGVQTILDLSLWMLIFGLAGGRLLFVLLNRSAFPTWLDIFRTWEGGLSFHGGLLGAVGALVVFAKRRGLNPWELMDLLSPAAALGYAVARIGCFLNGCCYGTPTNLPWGVAFPGVHHAVRVHPTQIYASAANFVLFAVLAAVLKAEPPKGVVFGLYLALYSVYRFLIEFLRRGATARVLAFGLTEAQFASAVLFAAGIALVLAKRKIRQNI